MAFAPIAYIAQNYRDYPGWWLKVYEPSTTTPKVISTDIPGTTTVSKLQLNADGFIVSAGGAIIMPYLNGSYDAYLFPTETEADNNDTTNAVRVADNIASVFEAPDEILTAELLTRDVNSLLAPVFNISELPTSCVLKKLRDTLYTEFSVHTPLTADGAFWHRWFFTNRFNVTNDGAPRMLMCSLSGLHPSTTIARIAANNVSETRATATTATRASAAGTAVGTWVGPATVLTTTDVLYSDAVGDTLTYTITGAERIELRGLLAGNGGIGKVTITESAVEIPEGNYLLPADHLVNFISTATGDTTMHIPLAEGLTSGSTYTVQIEVDASNPVGNRVYQAGLLGFNDIAFDDTGVSGILLDAALGGLTNSMSVTSGTRSVYQATNVTKLDWKYIQNPTGSIVNFKVFDSGGTEISEYINQSIDQYAVGSTAKKVPIASNLTKGTYYLHVINGKTKNAASSSYRYYSDGAVVYDQTIPGTLGTDEFDNFDVPDNIQDPNNDTGQGSKYVLIGTGNLEMAISIRKLTDAIGDKEFVGGIHGFETTPTPVFYKDGVVFDYASAAAGDEFTADSFDIDFTTTLKFPVDSSDFATCAYKLKLSQSGYAVGITKTTLAESYIHNDFNIMLNVPNTDNGSTFTQGENVGGGYKFVCADNNYEQIDFDNSGVFIEGRQQSVAMVNEQYLSMCTYTTNPILPAEMKATPFITNRDWSLIQDRTDRTVKFYTRAFNGDETNGVLTPAGLTWSDSKVYRCAKGRFKGLVGL